MHKPYKLFPLLAGGIIAGMLPSAAFSQSSVSWPAGVYKDASGAIVVQVGPPPGQSSGRVPQSRMAYGATVAILEGYQGPGVTLNWTTTWTGNKATINVTGSSTFVGSISGSVIVNPVGTTVSGDSATISTVVSATGNVGTYIITQAVTVTESLQFSSPASIRYSSVSSSGEFTQFSKPGTQLSIAGAGPLITSSLSETLPSAGMPFNYTITAINNPTSFYASGFPPGLSFDPATGAFSGTPTAAGEFKVAISAINNQGTNSQTLTLKVPSLFPVPTVPIKDAGNAADTNGYGPVNYLYDIGKFEITVQQYTEFLNAVAVTNKNAHIQKCVTDVQQEMPEYNYGYRIRLEDGGQGSVVAGSTVVPPIKARGFYIEGDGKVPVAGISIVSAARFCNWLHNGARSDSDTENGSYALNGAMNGPIKRNAMATWVLPSEDEWYKAAYYKGGGASSGYWKYPTRSDTPPTAQKAPPGSANSANYGAVRSPGGPSFSGVPLPGYLTPVGAYSMSPSAYGTFDQGGNVWERVDGYFYPLRVTNDNRGVSVIPGSIGSGIVEGDAVRGGSAAWKGFLESDDLALSSGSRRFDQTGGIASAALSAVGFRVAKVVPGSMPRQAQTISFPAPAVPKNAKTFQLAATASSGLPVVYSINPKTGPFELQPRGQATVSGNTVTVLAAGWIEFRAEQPGNANFLPAVLYRQHWVDAPTGTTPDTQKPVITLLGANPIIVTVGSTFTDPGANVTDNVDAERTITGTGAVNTSVAGTYTRTYTASDAAGNAAAPVTRTVRVIAMPASDTQKPVIALLGSEPTTIMQGKAFADPGATVTDNVDAERTITGTGTVNTSVAGTYTVTYSASDAAGNAAIPVTRRVIVSAPSAPLVDTFFIANQNAKLEGSVGSWAQKFTVNATTTFQLRFATRYAADCAIFADSQYQNFMGNSRNFTAYAFFDNTFGFKTVTLSPGTYWVGVRNQDAAANAYSLELDFWSAPAGWKISSNGIWGAKIIEGNGGRFSSSSFTWKTTSQSALYVDGCHSGSFECYVIAASELSNFRNGKNFRYFYKMTGAGAPGLDWLDLPSGSYYLVASNVGKQTDALTFNMWTASR